MSLAHHYRRKFAAQRGDRAVLYLAIAVAFHLGGITWMVKAWHPLASLPFTPDQALQPIEFVYLEAADATPPESTDYRSSISAVAGGDRNDKTPINPGKLGVDPRAIATPDKPILPALQPISSSLPANLAPEGNKALSPSAAHATEHKANPEPTPVAQTLREPLPQPQPASPGVPTSSPTSVGTSVSTASTEGFSQLPLGQELESLGTGLDGLLNPNRSDRAPVGIDVRHDPVLGHYMVTINQAIYQNWRQIAPDATRETIVRFVINRQGELVASDVIQPSGSTDADQIALQAVALTAPFAPLPPAFPSDMLRVTFTFTHRLLRDGQPRDAEKSGD